MAELQEKDFIQEGFSKNPKPFWAWFSLVIFISLLFVLSFASYFNLLVDQYDKNPFLQVSNRQMSLFLWQNSSFMRVHAVEKNGYLPAFEYIERIGLNPEYADEYAIAPPEVFFFYHTWKRQIASYFFPRKIPAKEFQAFLQQAQEWLPGYWKMAPKGYKEMIARILNMGDEDLNLLPESILPIEVRQAFIGWKNYFIEGEKIEHYRPTNKALSMFLQKYPNYNRPFWCNIVGERYLKNLTDKPSLQDKKVPLQELSPFLQVALYNENQIFEAKPSS